MSCHTCTTPVFDALSTSREIRNQQLKQSEGKRPQNGQELMMLPGSCVGQVISAGKAERRGADRWVPHSEGKMQKVVSRSQEAEKRLERQLIHCGRQGLGPRRSDEAPWATMHSCCGSSHFEQGLPVPLCPKFPVLHGLVGQMLQHCHILPPLTKKPIGMFTPANPKGPTSDFWGCPIHLVDNWNIYFVKCLLHVKQWGFNSEQKRMVSGYTECKA